jgi:hypothetical protein
MENAQGKNSLFKKPYARNIMSALAVAAAGLVLLNLTFLLNFLVFRIIDVFMHPANDSLPQWFPLGRRVVFLVLITLISWLVFRSKWPVLLKAIFMTVPTAVALVTIGILLYPWPILPYAVGALLTGGILFYFYRSKKPWLYYYSVILVALTLAIFSLAGGEI